MPKEKSPGSPTTRRYSDGEKADAVRLVRQLRKELGSEHGTVQRVADQLGDGVESARTWVREADAGDGLAGLTCSGFASSKRRTRRSPRSCVRSDANEISNKAA